MNRQASIATSEVLDTLPSYQADLLAQKFIEIYKDPVAMVTYLSSSEFAQDILKLAGKAKAVFEAEQVLRQGVPFSSAAASRGAPRNSNLARIRSEAQRPTRSYLSHTSKPRVLLPQRCLFLESPIYVFGDTHGNLEDLHFFSDNIWKLGINLSAGRFLFLGG